jgi:membrane associated rhomboid family serine protease
MAPAPPRLARVPWGTVLLFVVSGGILLAQILTHARWSTMWLLSPGHVSLPSALTYAFFHADILHWAVNMALLLVVAPRLERGIGTPGMLGLFLLGAVVAGLLHVSMVSIFANGQEAQPLLGASGGIMALLGAYAVRYYDHPIAPAWMPLLRWPRWTASRRPRGSAMHRIPPWMISPASTERSCTAAVILSNGVTTGSKSG